MSDIKRYEITWNAHKDAPILTIEIDTAICTIKTLESINNFFFYGDYRVIDANGNLIAAALKVLAAVYFTDEICLKGDWSTKGIIAWYEYENKDGLPPMDGSAGIKILGCNVPGVNCDDMKVKEVS